jgi:hypothetical protein
MREQKFIHKKYVTNRGAYINFFLSKFCPFLSFRERKQPHYNTGAGTKLTRASPVEHPEFG